MRIVVLTVDLDLPSRPLHGGVLRVRQLRRHLRNLGHEVLVSMPAEELLEGDIDDEHLERAHREGNPAEILQRLQPDLVIAEQWHLASRLENLVCPLWLDLHGSLLGENHFRQGGSVDAAVRYADDVLAKLAGFAKADLVTCTGSRQRLYFLGWHAAVGSSYEPQRVVHLPMAVQPSRPVPKKAADGGLRYLYAGNLWPWINLSSWLPELLEALASRPGDRIDFFVDEPLTGSDGTDLVYQAGAGPGLERLREEERIRVAPRLDHARFRKAARGYDIAVDLFGQNMERELAVTTRTLEFLALGVPVLYPQHAELAHMITKHDSGWVVDLEQQGGVADVVRSLDATRIRSRDQSANAIQAMRDLERLAQRRCGECVEQITADRHSPNPRIADRFARLAQRSLKQRVSGLEEELQRARDGSRRATELAAARDHGQQELVTHLEREIGVREERIRSLERQLSDQRSRAEQLASQKAAINEAVTVAERAHRDAEARLDELAVEVAAAAAKETLRREAHEDSLSWRQRTSEELASVDDELRHLRRSLTARQLLARRPRHFRRGLRRNASLFFLQLDYLLTRTYMAFWHRLRRQRIFPGF